MVMPARFVVEELKVNGCVDSPDVEVTFVDTQREPHVFRISLALWKRFVESVK